MDSTPQTLVGTARRSFFTTFLPVPVTCFVGALITDLAYWQSASMIWADFSIWLISAGLLMAVVTLVGVVIDLARGGRLFGVRPSWPAVLGVVLATALALINAFVHSRDAYTSVVPTGLILSGAVVFILLLLGIDWRRSQAAVPRHESRRAGGLAGVAGAAVLVFFGAVGSVFAFSGTDDTSADPTKQIGHDPVLPGPHNYLLPPMRIAPVAPWSQGETPKVPAGFKVEALATGLMHPRSLYVLPNGDVLVVETSGPTPPVSRPKDLIMGWVQAYAGAKEKGGNRITLLRAATPTAPALRTVFIDKLFSPFGVALVGHDLYVANTDAVLRFPYEDGQTSITAPGTILTILPGGPIDHHWTKSMVASQDGTKLYVGVGSNSNITENGIGAELGRADVLEIDRASGASRIYGAGLRNPTGLGWEPQSGKLWAIVNERDELGPNLVPDYMTSVQDGGFYGWPYSYYGQHIDARVQPQRPDLVARAIVPDYALGSHMAPLGLAFYSGTSLAAYRGGAFVGEHGSWDRTPLNGYKVVFVPFANGKPSGTPQDVMTGFLTADGRAHGRPVGLAIDAGGALLVADDLGNTVWRMSAAQ